MPCLCTVQKFSCDYPITQAECGHTFTAALKKTEQHHLEKRRTFIIFKKEVSCVLTPKILVDVVFHLSKSATKQALALTSFAY
jgi:hypothetical protein